MPKHPTRPRDPNQLAKLIVDMSVGDVANGSPKEPESHITKARKGRDGPREEVIGA